MGRSARHSNARTRSTSVNDNAEEKRTSSLNINELVAEAVNLWKTEYLNEIKTLKAELAEVKESQDFIGQQYEKLKCEYNNLVKISKTQEAEIKDIKSHSTELEESGKKEQDKVDSLEQYGRRNNLEIVGVPCKEGENTNKIAMEVCKLIDVDITQDQISTSHRLQTKKRANEQITSPIIVRFISRDVRNKVFSIRKLIRCADMKKFFINGIENLYVNENLTKFRKKLFWSAKQKAKSNGFRFYWTANGNIFVRRSEESTPILIRNEDDLLKIQ